MLVDAHAHLTLAGDRRTYEQMVLDPDEMMALVSVSNLQRHLASGVTTIRDMGGEEGFLVAIRDAIKSGKALGPRYVLAGLVDGPGPRAFGAVTAATPDEGRAVVRKYHDEGFEQIKIYSLVTPDVCGFSM